MVIIRGTTPTFKIKFRDVDVQMIESAYLVIKQEGLRMIEKSLADADVGEWSLSWKLSQEDTLKLSNHSVRVTCDWKTMDGTRGRSEEITCAVEHPGKNEVI